jgi:hypothetical protein
MPIWLAIAGDDSKDRSAVTFRVIPRRQDVPSKRRQLLPIDVEQLKI